MSEIKKLQTIFNTLGDISRLKIIQVIGNDKRSVNEIVKFTKLSQPLVSHHLRTLKKSNLLETMRDGPFIYYSITDKRIIDAINLFLEIAKKLDPQSISDRGFFFGKYCKM